MKRLIAILLVIMFGCAYILWNETHAATVWTQQDGYFNWYKVNDANRYLPTTSLEVPTSWVKQPGTYIQCKSTGGANKYYAQGYDCTGTKVVVAEPPAPTCDAFVCKDSWGWTFRLDKNTALKCPRVKISKMEAQIYDGLISVNGEPTCN